jgi:hypothetical protein
MQMMIVSALFSHPKYPLSTSFHTIKARFGF